MIDHAQVTLQVPLEVDKGIAPLILECWRLGFATRFSCEGDFSAPPLSGTLIGILTVEMAERMAEMHSRWGYIAFSGEHAAKAFVGLVRTSFPGWPCILEASHSRVGVSVVRFHRASIETACQALQCVSTGDGKAITLFC